QGARSAPVPPARRDRADALDWLLLQDGRSGKDYAGRPRRVRSHDRYDQRHETVVRPRAARSSAPSSRHILMSWTTIVCARCTLANFPAARFCTACGLPLGSVQPDQDAGSDALGPYEAPEPADPDTARLIRELVNRSGFDAVSWGYGWRMLVPL